MSLCCKKQEKVCSTGHTSGYIFREEGLRVCTLYLFISEDVLQETDGTGTKLLKYTLGNVYLAK